MVQNLSATHMLRLNKFNVVPYHSLVITRQFEAQTDALNEADWSAAWQTVQVRLCSANLCLSAAECPACDLTQPSKLRPTLMEHFYISTAERTRVPANLASICRLSHRRSKALPLPRFHSSRLLWRLGIVLAALT